MIVPPTPSYESERLAALERYAILDTLPEVAFDELAQLASTVCQVPIALISLVDSERQWFKSRIGIAAAQTPRTDSFCAYAIAAKDGLFVVRDATADQRFADNPLVTGDPNIRFYAGALLKTPEGHAIGTLCVIDRRPRVLDPAQLTALTALARQVMVQLELRRQIAEKAVAERELDRFFDVSLDLLCIAGLDGRFRRLNPAFETVLGYSVGELVSRPFVELVHPDDRAATLAEMTKLREGQTTCYFENRYVRKDGGIRWLAWTASPATAEGTIYAAARDITHTKLVEHELRRSEARTRSIIDNSLGALITTSDSGVIDSVNPAAERIFGYRADELIGRTLHDLLRDFDSTATLGRVTECPARRKDGETFTCEVSLFEFQADDDRRRVAAHLLDVSERHAVDQLKKEFISTVSHELRTPLTSIRGSLGLLGSGVMGELSSEAKAMLTIAERNSVRLISLINDILDFDKLENGKMEMERRPTALRYILEHAIESISAVAVQDGVTIDLHCPPALILGDEERLLQVTVNLLSNAVKYSERGGVVTVEAVQDGDEMLIRVQDRGRGIGAELQKKLFQRFQRADSSDSRTKPGTGLGLAICKAIVEQHGGTIGVESREGEGSTFWFRIPLAVEEFAPDVLLIEDDATLLEDMSRQLASSGMRVRTARTGWSGLAAIDEHEPSLIVLDVDLPDLDGYGVVEQLRNHPGHRRVPLLVFSGIDLTSSERHRLQLGPTRFMRKSRSTDGEFRTTVGQLVGQLLDAQTARTLAK